MSDVKYVFGFFASNVMQARVSQQRLHVCIRIYGICGDKFNLDGLYHAIFQIPVTIEDLEGKKDTVPEGKAL